jgi:NADP-dependent 3-hydroxy acid dehydrogenase YdfG
MELKNKVVVVTGVSTGIGSSMASMCADRGASVYGLGRKPGPDGRVQFIETDVRDMDSVSRAFQMIPCPDVLVNNAGLGYFGYMEDLSPDHWRDMFQTNVDSIFYTCRMVLKGMKERGSGHILNIASTAALEGMPQVSGYCATKWAVKGLTESLWREVRDFKVKVTCVYPGSTKTDFFRNSPAVKPHDYMLMPEDIALMMIHAIEAPDNCHQVNLEIRPLQPKGPSK